MSPTCWRHVVTTQDFVQILARWVRVADTKSMMSGPFVSACADIEISCLFLRPLIIAHCCRHSHHPLPPPAATKGEGGGGPDDDNEDDGAAGGGAPWQQGNRRRRQRSVANREIGRPGGADAMIPSSKMRLGWGAQMMHCRHRPPRRLTRSTRGRGRQGVARRKDGGRRRQWLPPWSRIRSSRSGRQTRQGE
jgi:hypothetical protein